MKAFLEERFRGESEEGARRGSESNRVGRQDSGIAEGYDKGHSMLGRVSSAVVTAGLRAPASCLTFLERAVWTWSSQVSI